MHKILTFKDENMLIVDEMHVFSIAKKLKTDHFKIKEASKRGCFFTN